MGQRAIFLDIDGTFADHGVVPPEHADAVRQARQRGHLVFLCTGRPLSMVADHILSIGFDGTVTGAGAHVQVRGQVLRDETFPAGIAARIVQTLDQANAAYLLENADELWGKTGSRERLRRTLAPVFAGAGAHDESGPHRQRIDPIQDIIGAMKTADQLGEKPFCKVSVFAGEQPLGLLAQQLGPEVGVIETSLAELGDCAGELYMAGVNKAVGIRAVQARLGLAREDLVGMGDGANDQEMLEYVGTGVAVEGASAALLRVATFTTPGPSLGGVATALRRLGLLESSPRA